MPDQNENYIDQQIRLFLWMEGVDHVDRALKQIKAEHKDLLSDSAKLNAQYGSLDNGLRSIVKTYTDKTKVAVSGARRERAAIVELREAVSELEGGIGTLHKLGKGLIFPTSMADAVKTTTDYQKSLLRASAGVNRLGIGLTAIETSLNRAANATSLTKQETVDLFNEYQKSMRFVSLAQFENLLGKIKGVVGANAQAIGEMQGAISSLSASFPGLADQLANINDTNRDAIAGRLRSLYLIGKINQEQYRSVAAYVSGNKQIVGADAEHQRRIQENIRTVQEFRRQAEKVGLAFGKEILPILTQVTKFLERMQDSSFNWGKAVKVAVGSMVALKGLAVGKTALGAIGSIVEGGARFPGAATRIGRGAGGPGVLRGLMGLVGGSGGRRSALDTLMGTGGGAASGGGGAGPFGFGGLGASATTPLFVQVVGFAGSAENVLAGGGGSRDVTRDLGPRGPIGDERVGFMATLRGRLPGMMKGLGVAALLAGASYGLKQGASALEKRGYGKTAGAVEAGGGIVGIGAGAKAGAAIGMLAGPYGAAIGAAAGGLIGAVKEWKSLAGGFKKIIGMVDPKAKERMNKEQEAVKKYEEEIKQIEDNTKKRKSVQAEIERLKESDREKGAKAYSEIIEALEKAKKGVAEARKDVMAQATKVATAQLGIKVEGTDIEGYIKNETEKIAAAEEALARHGEDMSEKDREAKEKGIKEDRKRLEKAKEILNKEEEKHGVFQDQNSQLKIQESRLSAITDRQRVQVEYAEALNDLFQSQSEFASTVVEKMALTGDIDLDRAVAATQKSVNTLVEEYKERLKIQEALKENEKIATSMLTTAKYLTEEEKAAAVAAENRGQQEIASAVALKGLTDNAAKLESAYAKIQKQWAGLRDMHQHRLQSLALESQWAHNLVELADNYAIGVGASARMRMRAFEAEGARILELKRQLETVNAEIAAAGGEHRASLVLLNQKREINNEILQSIMKQAQSVKAMRDGWVSAISAMNTGAGIFTKIIMNAEQNTAQIMRLEGAIRTSYSGAFGQRDAKGRLVEDVGFRGYEKFSQYSIGEIQKQVGRGMAELAYETPTDKRLGLTRRGGIRALEMGQKQDVANLISAVQKNAERTASKGLQALGAAGHKMIQEVVTAGGEAMETVGREGATTRAAGMTEVEMKKSIADLSMAVKPSAKRMDVMEGKGVADISTGALNELGRRITDDIAQGRKQVTPVWVVNLKKIKEYLRDVSVDIAMDSSEAQAELDSVSRASGKVADSMEQVSKTGEALDAKGVKSAIQTAEEAIKAGREQTKRIKREVIEAGLIRDPLIVQYYGMTKELKRFADETGLPSNKVLTVYSGFTEEIERTALEVGLPSSTVRALYSGFTDTIERFASNIGVPSTQFLVTYAGYINEINRIAEEKGLPPRRIITTYSGFTKDMQRFADERGIPTSELVVEYKGITEKLERVVEETGLTTDDLLMIYSGDFAKDKVIRKIREKEKIPTTIEVYYKNIVDKITSVLSPVNVPPDKIPVYYKNVRNVINRYAENIDLPGRTFAVRYLGAIDQISRIARNIGLPEDEFIIEYSGFVNQMMRTTQEQGLPSKVVPLIYSGYSDFLERGIKEVGLPIRDLIVKYPRLASDFERQIEEVGKPPLEYRLLYPPVQNEIERIAKHIGMPSDEFFIRYTGAIDEIRRVAKEIGIPPREFVVRYPQLIKQIKRVAEEIGLPPSRFLVQYTGITKELNRVALETGIPREKLLVEYYGFSNAIIKRVAEQGIPETALPVIYEGFTELVSRGIAERGIPRDTERLDVLYRGFSDTVQRKVREYIPEEKLRVVFDEFTTDLHRSIDEIGIEDMTRRKLEVFYEGATNVMTRSIIERNAPSDTLVIEYPSITKRFRREIIEEGIPEEKLPVFLEGFSTLLERGVEEKGIPTSDLIVRYAGFIDEIERMAYNVGIPESNRFLVTYSGITDRLDRVARETGLTHNDLVVKYHGLTERLERTAQEFGIKKEDIPVIYHGFTETLNRGIYERGIVTRDLDVLYGGFTNIVRRDIDEKNIPDDRLEVIYENLINTLRRDIVEVGLPEDKLKAYYTGFTDIIYRGADEHNLPSTELLINYPTVTNQISKMAKEVNLPSNEFIVRYGDVTKKIDMITEEVGLPSSKKVLVIYKNITNEIERVAQEQGLPTKDFLVRYVGISKELTRIAEEIGLEDIDPLQVYYTGLSSVLHRAVNEKQLTKEDLPVIYEGLTRILQRGVDEDTIPKLDIYYDDFKKFIRRGITEENIPDKDLRVVYDSWIKQVRLGVDQINMPDPTEDKLKLVYSGITNLLRMQIEEINKPGIDFIIEYPKVIDRIERIVKEYGIPDREVQVFIDGFTNIIHRGVEERGIPATKFIANYTGFTDEITMIAKSVGIPDTKDFIVNYEGVTQELNRVVKETSLKKEDLVVQYVGFTEEIEKKVDERGINKKDLPVIYSGLTEIINRGVSERGLETSKLPVIYRDFTRVIRRDISEENLPEENLRVVYDNLINVLKRDIENVNLPDSILPVYYKGYTNILRRGVEERDLPTSNLLVQYPHITDRLNMMAKEVGLPSPEFLVKYSNVTDEIFRVAREINKPPKDIAVIYQEITPKIDRIAREFGIPSEELVVEYSGFTDFIRRSAEEIGIEEGPLSIYYSGLTDILHRNIIEKGLTREELPVIYGGLSTVMRRMVSEEEMPPLDVLYADFKKSVRRKIDEPDISDENLKIVFDQWTKQINLGIKQINLPDEDDKLRIVYENYNDMMNMKIEEMNKPDGIVSLFYPDVLEEMNVIAREYNVPDDKIDIFYRNYTEVLNRGVTEYGLPDKNILALYSGFRDEISLMAKEIGLPKDDKFLVTYKGLSDSLNRTAYETGLTEDDLLVHYTGLSQYLARRVKEEGIPETALPVVYRGFTMLFNRGIREEGLDDTELQVLYGDFTDFIKRGVDEKIDESKLKVLYDELTSTINRGLDESTLDDISKEKLRIVYSATTDSMARGIEELGLPYDRLIVNYPEIKKSVRLMAKEVNVPPDKFIVLYDKVTNIIKRVADERNLPSSTVSVYYDNYMDRIYRSAIEKNVPSQSLLVYYTDVLDSINRKVVEMGIPEGEVPVFLEGFRDYYVRNVQEDIPLKDLIIKYPDLRKSLEAHAAKLNVSVPDLIKKYDQLMYKAAMTPTVKKATQAVEELASEMMRARQRVRIAEDAVRKAHTTDVSNRIKLNAEKEWSNALINLTRVTLEHQNAEKRLTAVQKIHGAEGEKLKRLQVEQQNNLKNAKRMGLDPATIGARERGEEKYEAAIKAADKAASAHKESSKALSKYPREIVRILSSTSEEQTKVLLKQMNPKEEEVVAIIKDVRAEFPEAPIQQLIKEVSGKTDASERVIGTIVNTLEAVEKERESEAREQNAKTAVIMASPNIPEEAGTRVIQERNEAIAELSKNSSLMINVLKATKGEEYSALIKGFESLEDQLSIGAVRKVVREQPELTPGTNEFSNAVFNFTDGSEKMKAAAQKFIDVNEDIYRAEKAKQNVDIFYKEAIATPEAFKANRAAAVDIGVSSFVVEDLKRQLSEAKSTRTKPVLKKAAEEEKRGIIGTYSEALARAWGPAITSALTDVRGGAIVKAWAENISNPAIDTGEVWKSERFLSKLLEVNEDQLRVLESTSDITPDQAAASKALAEVFARNKTSLDIFKPIAPDVLNKLSKEAKTGLSPSVQAQIDLIKETFAEKISRGLKVEATGALLKAQEKFANRWFLAEGPTGGINVGAMTNVREDPLFRQLGRLFAPEGVESKAAYGSHIAELMGRIGLIMEDMGVSLTEIQDKEKAKEVYMGIQNQLGQIYSTNKEGNKINKEVASQFINLLLFDRLDAQTAQAAATERAQILDKIHNSQQKIIDQQNVIKGLNQVANAYQFTTNKTLEDYKRDWAIEQDELRKNIKVATKTGDRKAIAEAEQKYWDASRTARAEITAARAKEGAVPVRRELKSRLERRRSPEERRLIAMGMRPSRGEVVGPDKKRERKDEWQDSIKQRREMQRTEYRKRTGEITKLGKELHQPLKAFEKRKELQQLVQEQKKMAKNEKIPTPALRDITRTIPQPMGIEEKITNRDVIPHPAAIPEAITRTTPAAITEAAMMHPTGSAIINVTLPSANFTLQFKNMDDFKRNLTAQMDNAVRPAIVEAINSGGAGIA